jgi:hypothetical protein
MQEDMTKLSHPVGDSANVVLLCSCCWVDRCSPHRPDRSLLCQARPGGARQHQYHTRCTGMQLLRLLLSLLV